MSEMGSIAGKAIQKCVDMGIRIEELESQLHAADELAKTANNFIDNLNSYEMFSKLRATISAYEKARGMK